MDTRDNAAAGILMVTTVLAGAKIVFDFIKSSENADDAAPQDEPVELQNYQPLKSFESFVEHRMADAKSLFSWLPHRRAAETTPEQKQREIKQLDQAHLLDQTKEELLKELAEIPEELKCSITLELLVDPIITPQGICFSRGPITESFRTYHRCRCPLTNIELELKDFVSHDHISQLVNQYRIAADQMAKEIKEMTVETRDKVWNQFTYDFKKLQRNIVKNIDQIKLEHALNHIKNNLKINRHDIEHLQYWHEQTNHCFHKHGGVNIIHAETGTAFRVPTRIHKMMEIADRPYNEAPKLLRALDHVRKHKPSFWSNPLSFSTRTQQTARVYQIEELTKLRLI